MDTRSKILSAAGIPARGTLARGTLARGTLARGTLAMVTGYFDVLRSEHVRELAEARRRAPDARLVAVVLERRECVLSLRARAQLVAALRMVDYVVTADAAHVDTLVEALKPALLVRLESGDLGRAGWLKQHVHRRQG